MILLVGCARGQGNAISQPAEPVAIEVVTQTVSPQTIPTQPPAVITTAETQPTAQATIQPSAQNTAQVTAPAAAGELTRIAGDYLFTEGPEAAPDGSVYFSDVSAGKIYKWSPDGSVQVFKEGLNLPNGLAFDRSGNLIACEGGKGRLISVDPQGQVSVVVDQYNGQRFNEPNDLWIDAQGGIYFTDPAYQSPVAQDGEHVYYLSPDRSQVKRVISDFIQPNGISGSLDGKQLIVTDPGAGQTFRYDISSPGVLTNKTLLVGVGSDGLTLDASGNLFLTTPNKVQVFDKDGKTLWDIPIPENPTNLTFAGADGRTLFITARTQVYTLQLQETAAGSKNNNQGFSLSSPIVTEGGALPVEYTCDGASMAPTLSWSGAPAGTQAYALVMHHVAGPQDVHWYWVVYNLPASVTSLDKDSQLAGTLGTNSVNGKQEYTPPCSKGPGLKDYIFTVYALSAQPQFSVPAAQVDRDTLLSAIQGITLASAELNVTYTRK